MQPPARVAREGRVQPAFIVSRVFRRQPERLSERNGALIRFTACRFGQSHFVARTSRAARVAK
jgi:hypothetical protein